MFTQQPKSIDGYVYTLASGAISWCFRHEKIVSLSTTKTNYTSIIKVSKEAIWSVHLWSEFGRPEKAPVLGCDSKSAICLANKIMFHAHTKHIDVRYRFIREVLEDSLIT